MQLPEIFDVEGSAAQIARLVLSIEIQGIQAVMDRLDDKFESVVDLLYSLRGRIIITGIGKSGLIARKIAATLTSTGSPAIFVHPCGRTPRRPGNCQS